MSSPAYIRWFETLRLEDLPLVGGKNASLGELICALTPLGIRVPSGFAAQLAGVLKQGLEKRLYDHLVLVCPPRFLGHLRGALDQQVAKRVVATMDHEYLELSPAELLDRLRLVAPV